MWSRYIISVIERDIKLIAKLTLEIFIKLKEPLAYKGKYCYEVYL